MQRHPWDSPASEVFPQITAKVSWRIWVYRAAVNSSYDQVAQMLKRAGYDCNSHLLRSATEAVGKQGGLRKCPRCDRLTTSQKYCTVCTEAATEGILTPREKARIAAHYQQAHYMYGKEHHPELEDAYTK